VKVIFNQSVQVDGKPYFKGDKGEISQSMFNTLKSEGVKVEKAEDKPIDKKNDNKV
jgi:hypothetical protein